MKYRFLHGEYKAPEVEYQASVCDGILKSFPGVAEHVLRWRFGIGVERTEAPLKQAAHCHSPPHLDEAGQRLVVMPITLGENAHTLDEVAKKVGFRSATPVLHIETWTLFEIRRSERAETLKTLVRENDLSRGELDLARAVFEPKVYAGLISDHSLRPPRPEQAVPQVSPEAPNLGAISSN